ncbi:MAG: class I SAM-dependent methyltransferase [Gammaproteobacteria bacterium]
MPRKLFVLTLLIALALPLWAATENEGNVNPGINRNYVDPDPQRWRGILERDGREVWDRREDVLKALRISPGMAVADIGAGTGFYSLMFARATGASGHVYAVDIAENFIQHIEQSANTAGLANITGVVNDQKSVRLPSASVDLAFISDTYHHFEYPITTLRSLHEALKPGGEVVVIDFKRIPGVTHPWVFGHVRAGKDTFRAEIESAGFELVEDLDFMETQYFLRFRKRQES